MNYTLQTEKPVALDSPDHIQPHGTMRDNSRNPLFNRRLGALFSPRRPAVLDMGCSGGGFVKSCVEDGWEAVGLEGSDYSKKHQRAEWRSIPERLFTCDVTAPFELADNGERARFDAVTSWELIEHIKAEDLPAVCRNVLGHLAPGGLWFMSVSTDREVINGHVLHQTVQPRAWWLEFFQNHGLIHQPQLVQWFENDWVRGPMQGAPGSFHLVLSRHDERPPTPPAGFTQAAVDLARGAAEFFASGRQDGDQGKLRYALALLDRLATQSPPTNELQLARENIVKCLGSAAGSPAVSALAGAGAAPASSVSVAACPTISIVTPSYNCVPYLRQCIESVLRQGYPNVEHIIADGGSTDGTVDLLKQYPHLKWISEKDGGEAEALNKALRMSSGQIINWLNADDAYVGQGVLQAAAEAFAAHPQADVIYGKALVVNESGDVVNFDPPRSPLDLPNLMRWFADIHLMQPSLFYRRAVHEKVGFYREDLYFSIDYDYWLRIAAAGFRFQSIDRTLSMSRLIRDGAKSAAPRILQEKNWQEIAASYAPMLETGARYTFWKDYYAWRLANAQRYNEPIDAPPDPQALTALAEIMLSTGQIQTALSVIQDHLNRYPQDSDAHYLASQALTKSGQLEQARKIAQQGMLMEERRAGIAPVPARCAADMARKEAPQEPLLLSAPRASAKKALIFFPHNPLPSATGAHQRCLTVMRALRELGYRVDLFSSTLTSDQPWTCGSFEQLKRAGFGVHLHEASGADAQYQRQIGAAGGGAFGQRAVTPSMKQQFRRVFEGVKPDLVMINYAHFGGLACDRAFASAITAIDMLDLVSANERMRMLLWKDWGNRWSHQFGVGDVPAHTLDEGYFHSNPVEADPAEWAMYNAFNRTLAIAAREAELIAAHAPDTQVSLVPAVYEATDAGNTYDGEPAFVIGSNIFNAQGYLYFAGRVAPGVRAKIPQFNVRVVGGGCKMLKPQAGMTLMGFVPRIDAIYASAPFAICPLIGGTGQQIKVIEAMSRGVPVICLKNVAHSSPIEHGVNGLIASNADEFGAYVEQVWRDRDLCRKLGQAARQTVAERFTMAHLIESLDGALGSGGVTLAIAA